MEQRLDARYLRPGPMERATAVGLGASGIGMGILLAAWGLSFLWHFSPPEFAVRIDNPELRVTQDEPLKVEQDKPFVLAQPKPLEIDPAKPTIGRNEPQSDSND